MKASLREKRTGVRMGWELAALEKLAIDILCDGEYQAVMSKAAMSRLSRAVDGINRVRQEADSRSARRVALMGRICSMAAGFREKLTAEAAVREDKLYNLLEGSVADGG